jgi:hypothetical protein
MSDGLTPSPSGPISAASRGRREPDVLSTWVKRAEANDLPSQAFRGTTTGVTYVNDGFDEDAPIGSQEIADTSQRLTMKVVRQNQPSVTVTYEAGMPVLWTETGADPR